ncbi:hypothetical protein PMAYCL1PPCAC_25535, partial [Pristionchus mayeri]
SVDNKCNIVDWYYWEILDTDSPCNIDNTCTIDFKISIKYAERILMPKFEPRDGGILISSVYLEGGKSGFSLSSL